MTNHKSVKLKAKFTILTVFIFSMMINTFAFAASGTFDNVSSMTVPIYRFYSASMTDYFYTIDENEKDQLIKDYYSNQQTYEYEGIVGYAYASKEQNTMPVYRFWNEKTTDHFYTASETEKDAVIENTKTGKDNYKYEGVAWYYPLGTGSTVFRYFDDYIFSHYYTSNPYEHMDLVNAYKEGTSNYRPEGIAFNWFEY